MNRSAVVHDLHLSCRASCSCRGPMIWLSPLWQRGVLTPLKGFAMSLDEIMPLINTWLPKAERWIEEERDKPIGCLIVWYRAKPGEGNRGRKHFRISGHPGRLTW